MRPDQCRDAADMPNSQALILWSRVPLGHRLPSGYGHTMAHAFSVRLRLREDDDVLASWDEMINAIAPRSGMYVGRAKYSFVRCYVQGFAAGRGDDVLDSFQRWLSEQPQHNTVKNYAW
jgi:hypothetical protein